MSLIEAALKPQSILIATDFSEASENALRYALALARFYKAKLCLANVVSSLGPAMAGPSAIAACDEAVLREAAQLEASLGRTEALTGIQHKFMVGRVNCGRNCKKSSGKRAQISSSSARTDGTA